MDLKARERTEVLGCLFDKDGTLFEFHTTWSDATYRLLQDLSQGDQSLLAILSNAIGFDLHQRQLRPDSIAVAGTNEEIAGQLVPHLPGWTVPGMIRFFMDQVDLAPLTEAVPLAPFLDGLRASDLKLGVMTNDSEHGARQQLSAVGVLDRFDFICGADSGHGAKPDPEPLLAFAEQMDIAPENIVMIGDSTHDLLAGAAAGMQRVAVLTGLAKREDLAPFADAVLPDIGHLPDWLVRTSAVT